MSFIEDMFRPKHALYGRHTYKVADSIGSLFIPSELLIEGGIFARLHPTDKFLHALAPSRAQELANGCFVVFCHSFSS